MTSFGAYKKGLRDLQKEAKNDKVRKEIQNKDKEQYQEELKLLKDYYLTEAGTCPENKNLSLEEVRYLEVKKKLTSEFQNPEVLKATSCLTDRIFHTSGSLSYKDRLHEYFTDIKRIGAESAVGQAFQTSVIYKNDLFIIKMLQNYDAAVHSAVVGLLAVNKLRDKVPNFMYTFDYFRCSPVMLSMDKKVSFLCSEAKGTKTPKGATSPEGWSYLVYENISPSITFREFCRTCTSREYSELLLQIFCALQYANETISFGHFDLHADNILLRDTVNRNMVITYPLKSGDIQIPVKKIAVIIDLDYSHIKVHNKDYGVYDASLLESNIRGDRSNITYDALKLIIDSLFEMYQYNKEAYEESLGFFDYFFPNEDDPFDVIDYIGDNYFAYPFDQDSDGLMPLIDLIYPPESRIKLPGKEFSCYTRKCLDRHEVLESFGFFNENTGMDYLLFYDMKGRFSEKILKKYRENYQEIKKKGLQKIEELFASFDSQKDLKILHLSPGNIFNKKFYLAYRNYIYNVGLLKTLKERIEIHQESLNFFLSFFRKEKLRKERIDLGSFDRSIKQDQFFVKSLLNKKGEIKNPDLDDLYDDEFKWYFTVFIDFS